MSPNLRTIRDFFGLNGPDQNGALPLVNRSRKRPRQKGLCGAGTVGLSVSSCVESHDSICSVRGTLKTSSSETSPRDSMCSPRSFSLCPSRDSKTSSTATALSLVVSGRKNGDPLTPPTPLPPSVPPTPPSSVTIMRSENLETSIGAKTPPTPVPSAGCDHVLVGTSTPRSDVDSWERTTCSTTRSSQSEVSASPSAGHHESSRMTDWLASTSKGSTKKTQPQTLAPIFSATASELGAGYGTKAKRARSFETPPTPAHGSAGNDTSILSVAEHPCSVQKNLEESKSAVGSNSVRHEQIDGDLAMRNTPPANFDTPPTPKERSFGSEGAVDSRDSDLESRTGKEPGAQLSNLMPVTKRHRTEKLAPIFSVGTAGKVARGSVSSNPTGEPHELFAVEKGFAKPKGPSQTSTTALAKHSRAKHVSATARFGHIAESSGQQIESMVGMRQTGPESKQQGKMRQMYLDFGQADFASRTVCPECGMMSVHGVDEDDAAHKRICREYRAGVHFGGWKSERVVAEYGEVRAREDGAAFGNGRVASARGNTDRIVEVRPNDPVQHCRKVLQVKAIVDQELGFVTTSKNSFEGLLFNDSDKTLSRGKTAYLYVKERTVVGLCIVEMIRSAHRIISATSNKERGHVDQPSTVKDVGLSSVCGSASPIAQGAVCRSVESERAMMGVHQIWCHRIHRQSGVAARLVDTARASLVYGTTIPQQLVAFSSPTADGLRFATRYLGTQTPLVYDCT